ncbi:hypothetical protein BDR03DRAFT_955189 [Suillus americanus]|nr:hypothetical protein BDR03DRAFT_955189 [Suillus americanus]
MADRYGFPINELRSGGQVVAGKPKTLSQLVDDVHSQLTDTDAHWLSGNALRMILDTRLGTLRSGGNAAAHCAFKEDLGLAIRDPSLHPAQRSTLKVIYMFTHNGVLIR